MNLILTNLINFGFVILGFAIGYTLSKVLKKQNEIKKQKNN